MRPKTHAYPIRYLFAPFIALISLFWMTGCANPEIDTQTNKSSLRVIHMGEKNSQLRIEINGDTRTQLPYGKSSGYIQLTPGTYTIKAYANGEAVASLTQVIDVKDKRRAPGSCSVERTVYKRHLPTISKARSTKTTQSYGS